MSRLSSRGVVALLALLGAGGLLVSGFRPWVTGAVDDAVLGATRISATGAEVAPGLSAVALSIAAAAIAAVAAGRIARVVALVAYAASVVIAVILTVRVLRDPEAVLGPVAASRVGRTGSIENVADPTVWPWGGPSSRYEVADAGGPVAGPRGERVASAWDELSAGRDPTDVGPDQRT